MHGTLSKRGRPSIECLLPNIFLAFFFLRCAQKECRSEESFPRVIDEAAPQERYAWKKAAKTSTMKKPV